MIDSSPTTNDVVLAAATTFPLTLLFVATSVVKVGTARSPSLFRAIDSSAGQSYYSIGRLFFCSTCECTRFELRLLLPQMVQTHWSESQWLAYAASIRRKGIFLDIDTIKSFGYYMVLSLVPHHERACGKGSMCPLLPRRLHLQTMQYFV